MSSGGALFVRLAMTGVATLCAATVTAYVPPMSLALSVVVKRPEASTTPVICVFGEMLAPLFGAVSVIGPPGPTGSL